MAGIDVGGGGRGRRAMGGDLNTLPFIDLMFVIMAFLLITAVWVTSSRIEASTQVPTGPDCSPDCPPPATALHVHVREDAFALVWKRGATVLDETTLPRRAVRDDGPDHTARYPILVDALTSEWSRRGAHRDPADAHYDQIVVHTDDRLPFGEMVAVLDAIGAVRRDVRLPGGRTGKAPAFQTILAER